MDNTGFRFDVLRQVLDASSLRQRVIANNVANVNTPGYHRLEVAFEDDLAKALDGASCGHALPVVEAKVIETAGLPERVDGNNVNIDQEMGDLSTNSLLYQAAAQIIASRVGQLRSAITGQ
jgi:flagellar basal-body rod protein FlgB